MSYTLSEYVKQTTPGNVKQFTRIKKLVMDQEKQTLEKLLFEMKRFEPCTDIRSIASIIELEGKNIIAQEDVAILKELISFVI